MAAIEPKTVILKDGRHVCIRTPVADDVPKVLDYLKVVFQDDRFFATTTEEAQKWQVPETEREHIEKCYKNVNKLLVVAVADDRIVSFSNIDAVERKRSNHVGQLGISILPDYRNNGLGTAVMQAMIDWATTHPVIEKLALGVWANNASAKALYEKMRFVEEGRKIREVKYADGHYDDCICMYRFVSQA